MISASSCIGVGVNHRYFFTLLAPSLQTQCCTVMVLVKDSLLPVKTLKDRR